MYPFIFAAALNPLCVALLGVIILKEQITLSYVCGGILIMAGILLAVIKEEKD